MRLLKTSLILLFVVACNTPKATYDYDQQVNFSQYSNYELFPDFQSGLSQLDENRLIRSLEANMETKGFSKSSDAGIYVNIYTETYQRDNRSRVGLGIGGGGGNVGVGVSGGIPVGEMDSYLQLTFDFIDAKNDALIWQAVVDSPFNFDGSPEQRQTAFDKIVEKALSGYPPKK